MKTTEGAQGHKGAFLGHDTQRGTGAFPYIGNAPSDTPTTHDEGHEGKDFTSPIEAIPGQTRILFSEATSTKHLNATGERAFIVAFRARRGQEEPGRWDDGRSTSCNASFPFTSRLAARFYDLDAISDRENEAKRAKITQRELDLARKWKKAGLLSTQGLAAVELAGK
jgi:hypothetical protein